MDGKEMDDLVFRQSRETLLFPFIFLGKLGQFDVDAVTEGGGESGKTGAVRLAVSRALCAFVTPEEREKLRLGGLLTRDIRTRERLKQAPHKGARAKWRWSIYNSDKRCRTEWLHPRRFVSVLVWDNILLRAEAPWFALLLSGSSISTAEMSPGKRRDSNASRKGSASGGGGKENSVRRDSNTSATAIPPPEKTVRQKSEDGDESSLRGEATGGGAENGGGDLSNGNASSAYEDAAEAFDQPSELFCDTRNGLQSGSDSASVCSADSSGRRNSESSHSQLQPTTTNCCSPDGCLVEEPIDLEYLESVARVMCNNPDCKEGQFMHQVCFDAWEEKVLAYLSSTGRARSWSEKQRQQNLWTKKGYDLVFKACSCLCGRGHLQKDLTWIPPKADEEKKKRSRKKSGGKQLPSIGKPLSINTCHHSNSPISHHASANVNGSFATGNSSSSSNNRANAVHSPYSSQANGYHYSARRNSAANTTMPTSGIPREQQQYLRETQNVSGASGGTRGFSVSPDVGMLSPASANNDGSYGDLRTTGGGYRSHYYNNGAGGEEPRARCFSLGSAMQLQKMKKIPSVRKHSQPAEDLQPSTVDPSGRSSPLSSPSGKLSGNKSCSHNSVNHFSDDDSTCHGSIFHRRDSLSNSDYYRFLPRTKINGYHIKMEDDCPQGNDETRCFVLTNLGDRKLREVNCALCRHALTVYDKYPLIDGTFFLSPINQSKAGIPVKWEGNERFLLALCISCLLNSSRLQCGICSSVGWFMGSALQLGSMYTFDVISAFQCCPPMCKSCRKYFPLNFRTSGCFSSFSDQAVCPNCGHKDYHFLKSVENLRLF